MDQQELSNILSDLPLGEIRYYNSIGSTNDAALAWAAKDAPDLSIIAADEQTAGRGRYNRRWFTPPASALAFSLILRPTADEKPYLSRIVGLTALAVADAFTRVGFAPQIKWPNDILLNGNKVAGILIELAWAGEKINHAVIGVGINVAKKSVPPMDMLRFPAISLEHVLGAPPNRNKLLHDILASFISLRPHMHSDSFMASWEKLLAYYNQDIRVEMGDDRVVTGKVTGLESNGALKLVDGNGKSVTVQFGDVQQGLFP